MHNLVEYSDSYSKTSRSLWQYYRDELALANAGTIVNFHADNNSASFKFKQKLTGKTPDDGTKDIERSQRSRITGCLLSYNYFNNYYKVIATYLSKQQAHDADSKVEQQINFTANKGNKRNCESIVGLM